MRLHLQVTYLKDQITKYESMMDDVLNYLHSSKFNKYQESSPNQNCNYVNLEDILRRLDVHTYDIEVKNE